MLIQTDENSDWHMIRHMIILAVLLLSIVISIEHIQTHSLIFSPHTCAPTQRDSRLNKGHYHPGRNSSQNLGFIFVSSCASSLISNPEVIPVFPVSHLSSLLPVTCSEDPASVVGSVKQIPKWSFSFQTYPILMTSPIAPRSIFLKRKLNHVVLHTPLPA